MARICRHVVDVPGRFLRLIAGLLKAGYLENWRFHTTLSGVPQGGVVSPVLANLYLDRLDRFVETTLWANWYFVGVDYSSYTLLRNTTNTALTVDIRWVDSSGAAGPDRAVSVSAVSVAPPRGPMRITPS